MDRLKKEFDSLSLDNNGETLTEKEKNSSKRLLYVEGHTLNKLFFILKKGTIFSFWNVENLEEKVKAFKEAATKSGFEVKIFYDYDLLDSENVSRWKGRREQEITSGEKLLPPNFAMMLASLFEKNNIEVKFTTVPGNEITIATFAELDGAVVLSRRRDFLKFKTSKFTLYNDFNIKESQLELITMITSNEKEDVKTLEVLNTHPITFSLNNAYMKSILSTKRLLLGCPSSLTKILGNPYKKVTSLREALYYNQKVDFPVEEILIEWDSETQEPCWVERKGKAKALHENLLADPMQAFEQFFVSLTQPAEVTNEIEWENYLFACVIIVIGICRAAYPKLDLIHEIKRARLKLGIKTKDQVQMPTPVKSSYKDHIKFNQDLEDFDNKFLQKKEKLEKAYESKCVECSKGFYLTKPQLEFYIEKKLSMPKRCKPCRDRKKH